MRDRFGEVSHEVAEAIVGACREAHGTSADTKLASGLRTDEPYGTAFWQILAISLVERLASVQGVETIKPTGSRFEIPIVNGSILYAARCSTRSGTQSNNLAVNWSQFREELFREVHRNELAVLPLEEWEDGTVRLSPPDSPSSSAVLVACVSSDRGGLERIYIGDGYIERDGAIQWAHVEELPVREIPRTALHAVSETQRFDDAPMPGLDMVVRESVVGSEGGS